MHFFFFLKCEAENLTNVDDEIIFKIDNTHTIKYINLFNWMWTWIEQQSSIMMSLLYWVACMCVQVCCWSNDVHTFQQAMVNIVCGGTYLMKLVKRWMRFTARYAPVLNKILASLESLCGRRAVACSFQSMSIYIDLCSLYYRKTQKPILNSDQRCDEWDRILKL